MEKGKAFSREDVQPPGRDGLAGFSPPGRLPRRGTKVAEGLLRRMEGTTMNAAARKKGLWILLAGLAAVFWAPPASGQYRSEYGDIRQTVARISSVTGDASFARGDDPENWQPADRNVPMTLGDRVYTGGRSRLELQVHGGSFIRIGGRTDLAALNLTDDTKQFSLKSGIASFQVRRLGYDEIYEVDTPNAAVTFERPGEYRVDVDFDGNTRVIVRR